jgi:hypothetical protein
MEIFVLAWIWIDTAWFGHIVLSGNFNHHDFQCSSDFRSRHHDKWLENAQGFIGFTSNDSNTMV